MQKENNLVWIDLEMTGLDLGKDTIVEIATIVTDNNLTIIAEGPNDVIHHPDAVLDNMGEWVTNAFAKSGLTNLSRNSRTTLEEAEQRALDFIMLCCTPQSAPLCGNSVYVDRAFLRTYMPRLEAYLHYRIIDVSSVKELVRRWYPTSLQKDFKKPENHRALEDIKYSVAELAHYRTNFFIQKL